MSSNEIRNRNVIRDHSVNPVRILQYGEGNFLRAFVDYMVDAANEKDVFRGSIAIVKPIPQGDLSAFRNQNNRFTVLLRGMQNGKIVEESRLITSVSKCVDAYADYSSYIALAEADTLEFIVSNTTEAGIIFDPACRLEDRPPASFPGKLTQFLFRRYKYYNGSPEKGLTILPVELIENNGIKLRDCVLQYCRLWDLEDDFVNWLKDSCVFCSTLVDRIVTGYPAEEAESLCDRIGYRDELLDVAEPFGLWVIESDRDISEKLPLHKAGQPVVFTSDQTPYRERKVRILNGAHTSTILAGYLAGLDTVGECMNNSLLRTFMESAVLKEIVPMVPMPKTEAEAFAASVFERFQNPFINHKCLSIALNSVSKWKSRILPSVLDYYRCEHTFPKLLTFSFAALLVFYTVRDNTGGKFTGLRGGTPYKIQDSLPVMEFFDKYSRLSVEDFVRAAASRTEFWGEDLTKIPGYCDFVCDCLNGIRTQGIQRILYDICNI